jgi:hypothetical protein
MHGIENSVPIQQTLDESQFANVCGFAQGHKPPRTNLRSSVHLSASR